MTTSNSIRVKGKIIQSLNVGPPISWAGCVAQPYSGPGPETAFITGGPLSHSLYAQCSEMLKSWNVRERTLAQRHEGHKSPKAALFPESAFTALCKGV